MNWMTTMEMGGSNGNSNNSSPWQRLTERGLQWRVEGCPQEVCAAAGWCSIRAAKLNMHVFTHGLERRLVSNS